jgi:hypothetical protein
MVLSLATLAFGFASAQCLEVDAGGAGGFAALPATDCIRLQIVEDGRFDITFDLHPVTPGHVQDLHLEAPGATDLNLCVTVSGATSCREAPADGVRYRNLWLPEGSVRVRVILRGSAGEPLQVALIDRGPATPGFAYEPNDDVATAWRLGEDLTIRGEFQGREFDVVRVDIEGDPQLWRVQVQGATVEQLDLLAASGRSEQRRHAAAGDRGVRLSNLYLLPGTHYLAVRGTDGAYALRMIALGPADEAPAPGMAATGARAAAKPTASSRAPPPTATTWLCRSMPRPSMRACIRAGRSGSDLAASPPGQTSGMATRQRLSAWAAK